jgi:tRNA threonylcarbamoyladenosine biosynthesis protein TsaE
MKFTVENEQDLTEKIYELLREKLKAGFSVGLIGDLGSGKTTLVQGLLNKLGIKEPVTSPTFTLRKIYTLSENLSVQHIDLYRIDEASSHHEIEEWLEDKDYLTFVEWPENIKDNNKYFDLILKLKVTGKSSREVEVIWN